LNPLLKLRFSISLALLTRDLVAKLSGKTSGRAAGGRLGPNSVMAGVETPFQGLFSIKMA